jgi:hypothetical protein
MKHIVGGYKFHDVELLKVFTVTETELKRKKDKEQRQKTQTEKVVQLQASKESRSI